jgi:DNA-binding NarL/FixJ family response regulator
MSAFLVVEDNSGVARSLSRLLRATASVVLAGTVAEGLAALDSRDRKWIGLTVDLGLPDGSGLEVVEHARAMGMWCPVLILTGRTNQLEINRAHDLHAAFLCKPTEAGRMRQFALSALGARTRLETAYREAVRLECERCGLTASEQDILRLALDGRSRVAMAAERDSSPATIKRHIANILAKTGASSLDDEVNRLLRVSVAKSFDALGA